VTVTSGSRALRSTCQVSTWRCGSPFDIAVRTWSWPSASSTLERTNRVITEPETTPAATAGRISRWSQPSGSPNSGA